MVFVRVVLYASSSVHDITLASLVIVLAGGEWITV